MHTIFIGGSRNISRLPSDIVDRLHTIMANQHSVLVGDATGVDKAVQQLLSDAMYPNVRVFCTGANCRNNLGHWPTQHVDPKGAKGFQFYAAKDREMAAQADFGFMIWDGQSSGTLLNLFRLAQAGKTSVVYSDPAKKSFNVTPSAWDIFLSHVPAELRRDLEARASPEESGRPAPTRQPAKYRDRDHDLGR